IAALHDIHKSLAVTLQFIGRFTRVSKKVGDATVVMNISDPKVGNELEILYAEDADWNKLIRQKSESTIQKEIDFHEFINNFSGELSEHISLWNLRPSFSTLIYETKCENWFPKKFVEIIPEKYKYWYAVNDKEKILVVVISREENVNWGKYKDIKNHSFDLCVAHWSDKYKALFLQCSDYDVINCNKLSKIICGNTTKIKNGEKVFNIFSDMERPLARNLGVSPSRKNISYTMHFGTDITTGLSKIDKAESELNNIFCWGYQGGERVSIGCSAKKGKVWSIGGGPITIWKDWCYKMADKIFDSTIEENKIIQDFLRPRELQGRHRSIPLLVQWSENILKADENKITISLGENEYKLYDINLEIINYSKDGPVFFKIFSGKQESIYKIQYNRIGCIYSVVKGEEVRIRKYSGDPVPLVDYVENDPIIVMYVDGSFSHNNSHISIPQPNTFFDKNKLNVETWADTNIQIESLGKENKTNSVQYKVSEIFKDDYEIIFNDDASGEAADIIAMRQESNDSFKLHLIHCKFSSDKKPGARIADFYTLCGQAQKCIRWKHNGIGYLVNHMKRRELSWQEDNKTRFLKGNMDVLNKLRKFSRFATNFIFEVTIVQPGLSKQKVSDDIIQLLGSTEDYLIKTSDATFNVICSD
ncbi:MAG: type III restriction endonuclease subunit R, partial [Mariniphaga sp.]|nr:type III restriction endonuclease subunit R [Mariniphaga sp.]